YDGCEYGGDDGDFNVGMEVVTLAVGWCASVGVVDDEGGGVDLVVATAVMMMEVDSMVGINGSRLDEEIIDGLGGVLPSNKRPIKMLCDNEPAIAIANDPVVNHPQGCVCWQLATHQGALVFLKRKGALGLTAPQKGDENPIRTLGDYSKPSHEGYRNTIELIVGNNVDIALYDNESWNDLRDFAKLVKAISLAQDVPNTSDRRLIELKNQVQRLMQPTQVNKITTSCKIYSGPYDTQYCMEDPEQAFVKSASLRTDEARGKWYTFKPEENNAEEEEREREGDPEDTNTITYNEEQRDTLPLEREDITVVDNLGPNRDDKEIEWLDVKEPLDLVEISEESVYESLIKEMSKCSPNYDFKIKRVTQETLKFPGKKFHRIRKGHARICMSYVINFTILENIETNIDPSLSHVIFGRPFVEIACLAIYRKHGLMTFTDGIKEITFKTPYKDPDMSELSSECHDLLPSMVILSEDDYDRGCKKPSDLEDGFYSDTIKLGPEYLTGMDDEGEVTQ
nr:MAK10-like protein [Tanacetum cinerariifolium]